MDDFTTAFLFINTGNQQLDYYQRATQSYLLLAVIGVALFLCSIIVGLIRKKFQTLHYNLMVLGVFLMVVGLNTAKVNFQDHKAVVTEYAQLLNIYDGHQYKTAEGIVQVLHTQRYEGHDNGDVIKVGNTEFNINYYVRTIGYHDTLAHGGVLTEGSYARIYYYESKSENGYAGYVTILRVDLKGQMFGQKRSLDSIGALNQIKT